MPRPLPPHVLEATGGDVEAVRRHILAAAGRVIDAKGLAAASTRAIADEAGISGGTLYNYFDDHTRLLAKSIVARASAAISPALDLPQRAGRGAIADNLAYFVRQAAAILGQLIPAIAATFSDAALLDAVREEMAVVAMLSDPARTVEHYLLAERALGRVAADADCRAAAALIVSLCHDDAFNRYLRGAGGRPQPRRREMALIVRSVATTDSAPRREHP
jgi:AcrR family transcriptional regulator